MNCHDVQKLLVAFLNGEITPSERKLIQAHLDECAVCQREVAALAATQTRLRQALLRRGTRAAPSPQAWSRLESRLAREAQPVPSRFSAWLANLVLEASRAFTAFFPVGKTRTKRFAFATLVAILTIVALGVWMTNSATPVSAQEILNRAYAAQTAAESQGIQHTKTQVYMNMQAMPGPKLTSGQEVTSILESYIDPQTGNSRVVVTDQATGQVMAASAFDGTYLYTNGDPSAGTGPAGEPAVHTAMMVNGTSVPISVGDTGPIHTIYRIPQAKGVEKFGFTLQGSPLDPKTLFEMARHDPNAKFISEQTLSAGRQVYVLQVQALVQWVEDGAPSVNPPPPMMSTLYFDKQTYQLVEQRTTMQQNGKEIVVDSMRQLVQETLPQTMRVAWNLSDLQGITVVDDPKGEHGPQLPVVISQQELMARTHSAYTLRTVPAGYTMQITAPPDTNPQEPAIYSITYRNSNGDIILINGGGMRKVDLSQNALETYTTRSGLKVSLDPNPAFASGPGFPNGARLTHAIVQTPDGTNLDLASSLPRERLKALAEELVLLK